MVDQRQDRRKNTRLRQLYDVSAQRPEDGQVLTWDSADGHWEPADVEIPEIPEPFDNTATSDYTSSNIGVSSFNSPRTLLSRTLSAGTWVVLGRTTFVFDNDSTHNYTATLNLDAGGVVPEEVTISKFLPDHVGMSAPVSMSWVVTLEVNTVVRLQASVSNHFVDARDTQLTALKVSE